MFPVFLSQMTCMSALLTMPDFPSDDVVFLIFLYQVSGVQTRGTFAAPLNPMI